MGGITATKVELGKDGQLVLPTQVQRAAGFPDGATVIVRTAGDGSVTVESEKTMRESLRRRVAYVGLKPKEVLVHVGGRTVEGTELQPADVLPRKATPDWYELADATPGGERLAVFTPRAVVAWLCDIYPSKPADALLAHAVLPEAAVPDLAALLLRASLRPTQAAPISDLLTDLAVLGLNVQAPPAGHETLVADTAQAMELVEAAAKDEQELQFTDALCAAAAVRLGLPLVAADLLKPRRTKPKPTGS